MWVGPFWSGLFLLGLCWSRLPWESARLYFLGLCPVGEKLPLLELFLELRGEGVDLFRLSLRLPRLRLLRGLLRLSGLFVLELVQLPRLS